MNDVNANRDEGHIPFACIYLFAKTGVFLVHVCLRSQRNSALSRISQVGVLESLAKNEMDHIGMDGRRCRLLANAKNITTYISLARLICLHVCEAVACVGNVPGMPCGDKCSNHLHTLHIPFL